MGGAALGRPQGIGISPLQKLFGSPIPHAEGGAISPAARTLSVSRVPEIMSGASGNITSNAASQRMVSSGGGPTHDHTI